MNILIYSVNPGSPHLAVDLELAKKYRKEGNRITFVRCTGQLRTCLVNPNHNVFICAACKSKYRNAFELLGMSDIEVVTLRPRESYYNIPKSFENIEELKAFLFEGADAGIAVASTLIGRFGKDHKFDTAKYQKEIFKELQMWVDVYFSLKQILIETKPEEVYFFNGRFSTHHPLLSLCVANNINFYTHERAGVMSKFMLRRNVLPHNISYALDELNDLWNRNDPEREQIGSKFFTDRRNKVIQSWVLFTESQQKGSLPQRFDRRRKNIAIFNSSMEEYEGMADWKNPLYKDDNDGLARILESFRDEKDYVFYLRVHPNLKLLRNTQMSEISKLAMQHENLCVIGPEDSIDSYELMEYADKVITFGSTMGAEATFWNQISILLGKSLYMNMDTCYQPSNHNEAVELIRGENLLPKAKLNAIKYGYWELTRGTPYEEFNQLDLHTMACHGEVVEASRIFLILEKISKLWLIRNKRDIDTVKGKIKRLFNLN